MGLFLYSGRSRSASVSPSHALVVVMPIVRLPGALRSLYDETLLSTDHAPSDIPAAMLDWDLRVHPNERELTRVSNEWFARLVHANSPTPRSFSSLISYKLLPPRLYEEWATSEFALLAAMCFPEAPDDKLRCVSGRMFSFMSSLPILNSVCMDYTSILFSYDDLMDDPGDDEDTKYMHDARGVEKAAQTLMQMFKNPKEFKPIESLPVLTTFHE